MKNFLICLLITAIASSLGCSDDPQITYNIIPVHVNLKATASDFQSLDIALEGVRIYSQRSSVDSLDTSQAGVQDMTMWESSELRVADFTVTYDSISFIEILFGPDHVLMQDDQTFNLALQGSTNSVKIPVDRYIQDLSEITLQLEFDVNQSVVEQSNQEYVLNPQIVLKN